MTGAAVDVPQWAALLVFVLPLILAAVDLLILQPLRNSRPEQPTGKPPVARYPVQLGCGAAEPLAVRLAQDGVLVPAPGVLPAQHPAVGPDRRSGPAMIASPPPEAGGPEQRATREGVAGEAGRLSATLADLRRWQPVAVRPSARTRPAMARAERANSPDGRATMAAEVELRAVPAAAPTSAAIGGAL